MTRGRLRKRANKRARRKNADSLSNKLALFRNGKLLPQQAVFVQSVKADSFDESQAASVPKEVLQVRGKIGLNVQTGDVFEYNGHRWQVTDSPIVSDESVAVRVLARRL